MSHSLITINPLKYEIKEVDFNKTYSIIVTVINPDPYEYDINILAGRDSYYLLDHLNIEPRHIILEPNDKKNIQLSLTIPSTLSPEEHSLYIDFYSANHELGKFKLSFTVPGEKIEDLAIKDVIASEIGYDNLLYFDFRLENRGTVIAKGHPLIEIYLDKELVESFGQESSIMIMPGKNYNLSMMLDTVNLRPGSYDYYAKFKYNDLETEYEKGKFTIEENKEKSVETINAVIGKNASYDLKLSNPTGELSFYSIHYSISGQNIKETLEGQIQGREQIILLDIGTSTLPSGEYDLEIDIKTGKKLEETDMRNAKIIVKPQKSHGYLNYLFPVFVLAAALTGAYYSRSIILRTKQKNPNKLESDIDELNSKFREFEDSMKSLSKDINIFIDESNNWLVKEGYGQYGFR